MATTDARSGFRLPWSSDRSHDAHPTDDAPAETAPEQPVAEEAAVAWPSTDFNARLGLTSQPRPADPSDAVTASPVAEPSAAEPSAVESPVAEPAAVSAVESPAAEEPQEPSAMIELAPTPPAPVAPKKPSKLMADLSAAIRATAESARDAALVQVDTDVAAVIEAIRVGSKEGEDTLRTRSEEDIAAIKEWSRAEIARIKEETEHRIEGRKISLDQELQAHAAAIEARVGDVEGTAAAYRSQMEAYSERMSREDDPARLATMAESMPEAPALEPFADLGQLAPAPVVAAPVVENTNPFTVEAEAVGTFEAVAEPATEPVVEAVVEAEPEPAVEAVEAVAEPEAIAEPVVEAAPEPQAVADPWTEPAATPWGTPDNAWGTPVAEPEPAAIEPDAEAEPAVWSDGSEARWDDENHVDDVPRWAAGETPDGFPTSDGEAGDPVDRGAIMAALEAAAEAVVAAESAAESADQAEAAADVAETAAELLKGRAGTDEEYDPEANAALSARVGAGGFEESYTDRLASLLPSHAEGPADGEPRVTQVIVSGLVSVASIASFKRHLGRLGGVQGVAVASGPDGEFVFNVTHRPDVSFRDAVPTMPGFAARVTSTGDGVVHVSARDPEAEG
jgi:hypothetical protein